MFDIHMLLNIRVKGFSTVNLKAGFQHFHLEITGILSSSSAVDVSISSTSSSSSFVGTMKNKHTRLFKILILCHTRLINFSLHFCKFVYFPLINT